MLIGENGNFEGLVRLPSNLVTQEDIFKLIPEGYDDVVEATIRNGDLVLRLIKDEYEDNDIIIGPVVFNPEAKKVVYPKFIFERNNLLKRSDINYFDKSQENYILNQNEILYICLQHRLEQYRKHSTAYSNLLKNDISAVKKFVSYIPSVAYNAIQKNKYSYAILSVYGEDGSFKMNGSPLGSLIYSGRSVPSTMEWELIKDSLPIQFSSDSGAGKLGKLSLQPFDQGSIYRSVGHQLYKCNKTGVYMAKSLFKAASNIGARLKTHVTANAYAVFNFEPTSVFAQDWVYNTELYPDTSNPVLKGYEPKDHCYREAIVAIRGINKKTTQFLYGEVLMSEDLYDTFIWEDKNIVDCFDRITLPLDGRIIYPSDKAPSFVSEGAEVIIGYAEEGEHDRPITVKNVKAVMFVRQSYLDGPEGKSKVTIRVAVKGGNSRIDSNTGLKGVTKGKPYIGKILLEDGKELRPQLSFGMNSFKAKSNGIALAQAALAVKLGTYKPKHWSGLLNTLDEKEVNAAAQSLPEYKFYNEFGEEEVAQIGIVYYRYTEIADRFKSFRDQSTSHETGRNLKHNSCDKLYNHLWNTYVDPNMKEALVEFQKVLCASDVWEGDGDLPYHTIQSVRRNKTFTIERDVSLGTILDSKSEAIYLDEEWNPNGFFLDFRASRGPLIRVPSAKILNMFINKLDSGAWRHHSMFISLSKIIRQMIFNRAAYIFDTDPKSKRQTLATRYLKDIRGVIFTTDETSEMNITALSRPMVPGLAMKQSVEPLLPPNTALILCKHTYKKAAEGAFGEDAELEILSHELRGLHVRSPSLWRSQVCAVRIWNIDEYRMYLFSTHGIVLEDYLLVKENHDVILFSGNVLGLSHSDVDE